MKVWLAYKAYYPNIGGIETRVYQLSKALSEMGHDVTVINGSHPPHEPRKEYAEIRYLNMPDTNLMTLPLFRKRWFRKKLTALVRETPAQRLPDCIVSCDELLANIFLDILPSTRLVLSLGMNMRKLLETTPLKIKSVRSFFTTTVFQIMRLYVCEEQKKALNRCEKNVVLNENIRQGFIKYYGVPPEKIKVCYPGVSLTCPNEILNRAHETPRKKLLYVGRVSIEKNVTMLIEALPKTGDDGIELTMVGDGPESEAVKALCEKYGLTGRVHMAGASHNVGEYYAKADFLVLPSRYESFGQVIIEGFTFGLPAIGYKTIPGVSETAVEELTQNGKNGFIADELTPEALAKAINRAVAATDGEYAEMSARCAAFAANKCSWQNYAKTCVEDSRA